MPEGKRVAVANRTTSVLGEEKKDNTLLHRLHGFTSAEEIVNIHVEIEIVYKGYHDGERMSGIPFLFSVWDVCNGMYACISAMQT